MTSYQALLLQSFGGPEGPDDVLPFLRNVTRGRGVPPERLAQVAEHYHHFGGVSPINEQNRALLAAIRREFAEHGLHLPVYWGNRNWRPYITDTLRQMGIDGVRRALSFVTSAYGSYSACRQYYEDIDKARVLVGLGAPTIDKLRHYFNHPGFVEPHADAVRAALRTLDPGGATRVVFTAHSIPERMDAASGPDGRLYSAQVGIAAGLVARAAGVTAYDVAWQSRSGPPQVPWLVPDVNDHLAALAADGVTDVVVSPVGFVSDHLEVIWDLDEEAATTAGKLGLGYARAGTPGTDPRFVAMVRELVTERLEPDASRRVIGSADQPAGTAPDRCPDGCCTAGR